VTLLFANERYLSTWRGKGQNHGEVSRCNSNGKYTVSLWWKNSKKAFLPCDKRRQHYSNFPLKEASSFWLIFFFFFLYKPPVGPDSSVGTATCYSLEVLGIESRWGARFSEHVETGPRAHSASYTMGTGSFPGVKRPGRVVDHPPSTSAEVIERVELYLYSLPGFSWPELGWKFYTQLPVTGQFYNKNFWKSCRVKSFWYIFEQYKYLPTDSEFKHTKKNQLDRKSHAGDSNQTPAE
jgi:hypothetical protein